MTRKFTYAKAGVDRELRTDSKKALEYDFGGYYACNIDNYPLMGMFIDFNATSDHLIQTICNSTISGFQFNGTATMFDVSGENGTARARAVATTRKLARA